MKEQRLHYFLQLDGLRCFAIIFVMIGHWISWESTNEFMKHAPWGHGVILFFVLSGYLISNILFEQKEKIDAGINTIKGSLATFYFRRSIRIFPIYYLLIFFLYYINFANTREIFPWLLTYTSNILQCITGEYTGNFNHFWSLAVEEQFYLIWPFIIFFVSPKKIFKVIIAFMIISFVSRVTCTLISPKNWMLAAYFTPNLFLPLCLGALIAYAKRYNLKLVQLLDNRLLLYGGVGVYALCYYFLHYKNYTYVFDMVLDEYLYAIVCTFIVYRASENKFTFIFKRVLEHDAIVFIGKISYGLYIYHLFIGTLFWDHLSKEYKINIGDPGVMWATYFVLAFIVAISSYYFIEKPMNRLKERLRY